VQQSTQVMIVAYLPPTGLPVSSRSSHLLCGHIMPLLRSVAVERERPRPARCRASWPPAGGSYLLGDRGPRLAIDFQGRASNVEAFQLGAPHAGAHPLDDQIAFQLSNGADDDDDSAPQRAAGVDVLAEADELDVEMGSAHPVLPAGV